MRTGDAVQRELARRWAKGTAILFAVGAVSGTVLSFELGLLWPEFMRHAGPLVGHAVLARGVRVLPRGHLPRPLPLRLGSRAAARPLLAGVVVAVSGALSGAFVVTANAWMSTPAGFTLRRGAHRRDRPVARDAQPRRAHRGRAHDARRVRRRRALVAAIHALRAPARSAEPAPPPRARDRAPRRRPRVRAAAAQRRSQRAPGRAPSAHEARGDGGPVRDGVPRAAADRRLAGRRGRGDALGDRAPWHAQLARVRSRGRGGRGARRCGRAPIGRPSRSSTSRSRSWSAAAR